MSKDQRETSRTEAFSDGVIAFAITLLVLNLKDPLLDPALSQKSLFQGLLLQWPAFFAFVTSFATILIMWVNHYNMFTYIRRVDTTLLFLNGLLLFFIVLTAFTTLLVANHVGLGQTSDGRTAVAFYTGNAMILGLVWSTISYYCAKTGLVPATPGGIRYLVGPVPYAIAFALSFVNAFLSLVVVLVIAGFWTLASRGYWRTALAQTD
ncbi:MAG TPA: TMEM175 family protein [Candidatus Bathyarchaeia archaeon]|nr:TMEM175 family protein [Candidatus Bathyarchaeia archaeon]